MPRTLRAKITFALFITGLTSAILVGLIARAIVMQQFSTVAEVHPGLAVTITIGVDGHVRRGSVEAMLASADGRLYEGKKSGRNRVCGEIEEAHA